MTQMLKQYWCDDSRNYKSVGEISDILAAYTAEYHTNRLVPIVALLCLAPLHTMQGTMYDV